MDVQVQVAGQITSKPTSTGGTKFDIPLSNGTKPSTFDAALATKVSQLGGQTFTARLEQKGKYTNLIAVAGPGETLTPEIPQAGTPIGGTPGIVSTPIVPQGNTNGNGSKKFTEADTIRITKLSALSTATQLVSSLYHGAGPEVLEEAVQAIEKLAKHIYAQSRSHEPGAVPQAAVAEAVVEQNPQAVAAFVAEQAGTPVVQVGAEGVTAEAVPATLPWS